MSEIRPNMNYSERPKSERSDFWHTENWKVFNSQTVPISGSSNNQTQSFGLPNTKPVPNLFQTGSVRRLGPTECSVTNKNWVRFVKPNVRYSNVYCIDIPVTVWFPCRSDFRFCLKSKLKLWLSDTHLVRMCLKSKLFFQISDTFCVVWNSKSWVGFYTLCLKTIETKVNIERALVNKFTW